MQIAAAMNVRPRTASNRGFNGLRSFIDFIETFGCSLFILGTVAVPSFDQGAW